MIEAGAPSNIPFPIELRGLENFSVEGLAPCQKIAVFPEWRPDPWDPSQANPSGTPAGIGSAPLLAHAWTGDVDGGREELRRGADVCESDGQGVSPLMVASQENHLRFVDFLLSAGAKPAQRDRTGKTALMYTVINNRLHVAKLLCESDPKLINLVDNDGGSLGMYCGRSQLTDMLRYLCDAQLDVNLVDCQGRTALMAAVQSGHLETVKILLEHGARTNVQCHTASQSGITALLMASSYSCADVMDALVKPDDINVCDQKGNSPLLLCCNRGDLAHIEQTIASGADVNHQNQDGMSPLMVAVCHGHVEVVKLLLLKKANLELKNRFDLTAGDFARIVDEHTILELLQPESSNKGSPHLENNLLQNEVLNILVLMNNWSLLKKVLDSSFVKDGTCGGHTPLMVAAQTGNLDIVEMILNKPIDINKQWPHGTTALAFAIANDHVAVYDRLIEYGADINLTDKQGQTMLFKCAADGNLDGLLKLERLGANIDKRNCNAETPLMAAAMGGHVSVVKYLYKMAAQIETKNKDGLSAFDLAKVFEQQQVIELLKDKCDIAYEEDNESSHALVLSCFNADIFQVEQMLRNNGAQINFRDPAFEMRTPLICAARTGDLSLVKHLVENGASVHLRDVFLRTALSHASFFGHTEVVRYLIGCGANVNLTDDKGQTALMIASTCGHVDIVQELVKQRAIINCKDTNGVPAIIYAARKKQRDVVHTLLETRVAHVDAVDSKKRTALFLACVVEDIKTVDLLLDYGADIDTQLNHKKTTPLMVAVQEGKLEMVRLLVERGASVKLVNYRGLVAHEIAQQTYRTEIKDFLKEKYSEQVTNMATDQSQEESSSSCKTEGEREILDMCAKNWGFEDVIKFSVEKGASVNCKDEHGCTPALVAAKNGHLKFIPWLLKYGADMNCRDETGRTALMYSLEHDAMSVADAILDHGVDLDIQDSAGRTALIIAVQRNMFGVAHRILRHTKNVNSADVEGNTALSYCAMTTTCDMGIPAELFAKGARDCVNRDSNTPLLLALTNQNQALAELLMKSDIDLVHRNNFQEDALILASTTNRWSFVKMLARWYDFFDLTSLELSLHILASNHNKGCINGLLHEGLNANTVLRDGETLAFCLVRSQNVELLAHLAVLGADVNHQNDHGQTIAMVASDIQDAKLIEAILSLKPDLDLKDKNGLSAMDLSLASANYTYCLMLQEWQTHTHLETSSYIVCECNFANSEGEEGLTWLEMDGAEDPTEDMSSHLPPLTGSDDDFNRVSKKESIAEQSQRAYLLTDHTLDAGFDTESGQMSVHSGAVVDLRSGHTRLVDAGYTHYNQDTCQSNGRGPDGLRKGNNVCNNEPQCHTEGDVCTNQQQCHTEGDVSTNQQQCHTEGDVCTTQQQCHTEGDVCTTQQQCHTEGDVCTTQQQCHTEGDVCTTQQQCHTEGDVCTTQQQCHTEGDVCTNQQQCHTEGDVCTTQQQCHTEGDVCTTQQECHTEGDVCTNQQQCHTEGDVCTNKQQCHTEGDVCTNQQQCHTEGDVCTNQPQCHTEGDVCTNKQQCHTEGDVCTNQQQCHTEGDVCTNQQQCHTEGDVCTNQPQCHTEGDSCTNEPQRHKENYVCTNEPQCHTDPECKAAEESVEQQLAAIQAQLQLKTKQILQQSQTIHSSQQMVESLEQRALGCDCEIDSLRVQLLSGDTDVSEVRNLKAKVEEVERWLDEVKSENQRMRQRLGSMDQQNSHHRDQVAILEQSLAEKHEQMISLETDIRSQQQVSTYTQRPSPWAEKAATALPSGEHSWKHSKATTGMKRNKHAMEEPAMGDGWSRDETRVVDIASPDPSGQRVLLYKFHMTISNSAMSAQSRHYCSSCSLAALLFVHKYKMAPCPVYRHMVTDLLFTKVTGSIAEANQIMKANFTHRKSYLTPPETLGLCSNLNVSVIEEVELKDLVHDTLLHYMMNIEPDGMLLLYRMDHYKVLGITASQDRQNVLVFDPQWHTELDRLGETQWYGAHLYYVVREVDQLRTAIRLLNQFSGDIQGGNKLVVLKLN